MKKFFTLLMLLLFFSDIGNAKPYRWATEIEEDYIKVGRRLKIDLPPGPGKWVVINNYSDHWGGFSLRDIHAARIVNNEVKESISVGRYNLQGGYTGHVDQAVYELMFTDKYDGCYERPEYYLLELYQRGVSHNCLLVRHLDVKKELYYPDDPSDKGNTQIKKYIKNHNVKVPPILLTSMHSYFTRLTGNSWYVITYSIDPKELDGPNSVKVTEETSEYHKYNIGEYPEHKKTMENFISLAAKRHKEFEKIIKAAPHHKLDLAKYINDYTYEKSSEENLTDELIKLKKLLDEGVITQEEFTKAKKKLLN